MKNISFLKNHKKKGMGAKDIIHDIIRDALEKDGWKITHDPFTITFGRRKIYADLGAEKLIAAERERVRKL